MMTPQIKKGRAEAPPFSNIDYLLVFQFISEVLIGALQLGGSDEAIGRKCTTVAAATGAEEPQPGLVENQTEVSLRRQADAGERSDAMAVLEFRLRNDITGERACDRLQAIACGLTAGNCRRRADHKRHIRAGRNQRG